MVSKNLDNLLLPTKTREEKRIATLNFQNSFIHQALARRARYAASSPALIQPVAIVFEQASVTRPL